MYQAVQTDRRYLGFAALPLLFGIQQFCEGFVWIGVNSQDHQLVRTASIAFLFFALAWWPFWFPLSVALVEPSASRRRAIGAFALVGLVWSLVLYLPVATNPGRWLLTDVVHHSIHYEYPDLPVYSIVPQLWLRVLYFATIAGPMLLCSHRQWSVVGLAFGASALVSQVVFSYAFVSVWCFFAAALSLGLCYLFATLPAKSVPVAGQS